MKPQHGIALVLLISLIACVAAAGSAPPALPHEFYGNVTIGDSPAPAGTVITAKIGDTAYGSVEVADAGRYGDPDWSLGNRLLVTATSDLKGETIAFFVGGAAAEQTVPFTPGAVTRLDLSVKAPVMAPTAKFTANVTSGPAPLTVRFTDTSTGYVTAWSWNFGDGANATDRNTTHTYTAPGTYTANLTVANAAGSSSATAVITVREIGGVEIVRGPYLTGTTTTATFINWMAQEPVAGTVEYADDAYYSANGGYEKSVADTAETAFHRVALENLAPDTLYHYRVAASNTTTGDHTFRTFPEDGGFTFIVYGDTQRPANIQLVADRIADEDPLFVLHTGDQVNGVESAGEWNDFFRNSGRMLGNTTIYTAMGNHEKNHTAYYENFGLPQRYSFTCSDAQFAILDDNNWVDINRESVWLKDDLDSDAAWKFVAHHHPPYSSTPERTGGWILLRTWGETMKNAGVSAVFNGHVHAYERYLVDGINYVVAGTGAGPLYRLGDERPEGYQTSLEGTLGYTKVTLHPNGTAVAGFVRVARLSDDANVLEVYPPGSVFETYTMTRPPRADLAAVGLTVPGGAVVGTACSVNGTVENIGDAASGACTATLTAGSAGIGTAAVGALAPGETAKVSFTWTPAAAGETTLALAVDPAAEVPDINRTNNARTLIVTVTESGGGGDAPTGVTIVSPAPGSTYEIGLPVQFSATATGAGLTYLWETGDGGSVTGQDVNYTYGRAGTYTVNLTVSNEHGSSSAQTGIVITRPAPIVFNTSVTVYADEPILVDNVSYGGNTFFNILAAAGYVYTYADSDAGYSDRKPLLTLTIDDVTYPTRDFGDDYAWKFYETIGTGDDKKFKKALNGYITGSGTYYIWFGDTSQFGSWDLPTVNNSIYVVELTVDLQPTRPAAPVANFTANVTSGDAPLAVAFTDASTGSPASWDWDFGDGATSVEQNPVHTYTAVGVYSVSLTATNDAGSDTEVKTNYITVTEPEPGNIEVTSIPAGAAIWLDGEDTGQSTNATLTNVPAGEHVVTLKLAGYADASTGVTIVSGETAIVNLTLTPLTGSIAVTSIPAGAAISLDGVGTGTVTNGTLTGVPVGTHTVIVTLDGYHPASSQVTVASEATAAVHFNLVPSALPPVAGFTAAPTDGAFPLTVQFTDHSINATAWSWTFGDGATSVEQHPAHTYTAIGRYNVILTATNIAGSDTLTRYRYISVRDVPSGPAENETGYPLHDSGTTVTTVGGQQQVTFNATAGNGTASGNEIHLATGTLNVTIRTDGLTEEEDGNLTGNVTGVLLESSEPLTAALDDFGNVSIAFNASMNGYNPGLTISTSIYDRPSSQASTSFTLAAADENLEITSTAYAVYFTKTNLGENDIISDAVLRMTVSPAWVEAHGGVAAIRVFRQGDDGAVSILETTYLGLDGDGMMVFEAISPDGFSSFAVAATKTVATPTQPPASGGGDGRGSATVTSTGTASLLTASSGTVLRPYLVHVDGNFAHLSLKTGVTALDGTGSPVSTIGIAPVSTLPGASSLAFSGYAVDCTPAGATFAPALSLVFTFTGDEWAALLDGADGDSTQLVVHGYDAATGAWTACPTSVNAAAGTVTASVNHFSTYALFIEEPAKPPVTTGPTPTVPAAAATTAVPPPPAETGEIPFVWIALAVLVAAALAGGYFFWRRRR